MQAPANIVLLVGDHHRADMVRRTGCQLVHTPNLDAMGRAGLVFSRAVTVFPESDVARAVLLSGVHAHGLPSGGPTGLFSSPLGTALAGRGYDLIEFAADGAVGADEILGRAVDFLGGPHPAPFLALVRLPPVDAAADIPQRHLSRYRGNGTPMAAYFAAATASDDLVGQVLSATPPANTLVIYTALTGEHFRYRDSAGHANTCHSDSIRIPLVFRWPGRIRSGRVIDPLVGLHDLAPTIADIAGTTLPDAHGRSLGPFLAGAAPPGWRRRIYVENRHPQHVRPTEDPHAPRFRLYPEWRQRAIWDGRYKLVLSADEGRAFLFDHAIDPEEEFNLYDVPRPSPHRLYEHFADRRQLVVALAGLLRSEAQELGDDLGVTLASAAIAAPDFGRLGPGEPLG